MTLQSNGVISTANINIELGKSSNAYFDINSSDARGLAQIVSGQITFYNFYGKSSAPLYWYRSTSSKFFTSDAGGTGSLYNNPKIAVDGDYIYVATVGPDASNSDRSTIYIVKINAVTNSIVWEKKYWTTYNAFNIIYDIEADSNNNVWITTDTSYTLFFVINSSGTVLNISHFITGSNYTNAPAYLKAGASGSMLLASARSDGRLCLVKFTGTNFATAFVKVGDTDQANIYYVVKGKPAIDSSGNIYIAGACYTVNGTDNRPFFVKFNSSGTPIFRGVYTTIYRNFDCKFRFSSIAVDSSGNIFVTNTDMFPSGAMSVYYITKFNSSFAHQWTAIYALSFYQIGNQLGDAQYFSNYLYRYTAYYNDDLPTTSSILPNGNLFVSTPLMSVSLYSGNGAVVFDTGFNFKSGTVFKDNSIIYIAQPAVNWGIYGKDTTIIKLPIDGSGTGMYLSNASSSVYSSYIAGVLPKYDPPSTLSNAEGVPTAYYNGCATMNSPPFFNSCTSNNSFITLSSSSTSITYSQNSSISISSGSTAYIVSGTYTWVAPSGITNVSAVAVGAGGGGSGGLYAVGGGGGALTYKNNYSVTPGSGYTVIVGAGGAGGCAYSGQGHDGGYSSVFGMTAGNGGKGCACLGYGLGGTASGCYTAGYSGGFGRRTGSSGGGRGGGAGGYAGNGGSAGCTTATGGAGSAGGLGNVSSGSCYLYICNGGSGGGVGLFGQGSSSPNPSTGDGIDGSMCNGAISLRSAGGGGGSGGYYSYYCYYYGWCSGFYNGTPGGAGAVRIIWGPGRSFPSTNTAAP